MGGGLKTTPPRVVYRISYAVFHKVNNDRVITQNTPKCVENRSDDQLLYICSSNYYQFFCNLDYHSENRVFFLKYETNAPNRPCA